MQRRGVTALMGAAMVSAAAFAGWQAGAAEHAAPAYVAKAVANPARPKEDTDRDAARKPAQMLEFAGIKPGETVVDLMPGKGYFSKLFAGAVGPTGKVYAFQPAEFASFSKTPFPASGSVPDAAWPNVVFVSAPISDFAVPTKADVVWTAQNYHDMHDSFMGPADLAKVNAAVFKALKPGGYYVILDHAAAAGSGLSATDTLHRIDPASVKAEVTAAGFKFVGESRVLANPADNHSLKVFDPSLRGHTDQFIYKFRKPA
ncbi:class I SAM-dependent methyltransferase [Caulobacter sp. KR2-114]|uniref:class I SAM-dependent methyltransferase n=1 Tax=Caulobacter sp. KR2-114 TaxID=3400912 RepID=UPI003BFC9DEA